MIWHILLLFLGLLRCDQRGSVRGCGTRSTDCRTPTARFLLFEVGIHYNAHATGTAIRAVLCLGGVWVWDWHPLVSLVVVGWWETKTTTGL